jgi:hypothetical protein
MGTTGVLTASAAARSPAAPRTAQGCPASARPRGRPTCAAGSTVVVQMLFPRMLPSASLSESVVFTGRFAHGYRVWVRGPLISRQ